MSDSKQCPLCDHTVVGYNEDGPDDVCYECGIEEDSVAWMIVVKMKEQLSEYMSRTIRLQRMVEDLTAMPIAHPLGVDLDVYDDAIDQHRAEAKLRHLREQLHIKVDDHIQIKGVDINDPNCEGRVVEVVEAGVYITNTNMPYIGSLIRAFVAFVDIEEHSS